ncbi:TPA: hypothetical protein IGZ64_004745 [Escherichia coli]|nr:hypothetical protein [Escherichia coli]
MVDVADKLEHGDTEAIDNLRYIISYLDKEEQKHGNCCYGNSEISLPGGLGSAVHGVTHVLLFFTY